MHHHGTQEFRGPSQPPSLLTGWASLYNTGTGIQQVSKQHLGRASAPTIPIPEGPEPWVGRLPWSSSSPHLTSRSCSPTSSEPWVQPTGEWIYGLSLTYPLSTTQEGDGKTAPGRQPRKPDSAEVSLPQRRTEEGTDRLTWALAHQ